MYTGHIIFAYLFNNRPRDEDKTTVMRKRKGFTLAFSWENIKLCPDGLILKLLLAGENFLVLPTGWNFKKIMLWVEKEQSLGYQINE